MAEVAINNELIQEYLESSSSELRDLGVNLKLLTQYLKNPTRSDSHGDRLRQEAVKTMELIGYLQEEEEPEAEITTPPEQEDEEDDQAPLEDNDTDTALIYTVAVNESPHREVITQLMDKVEVASIIQITGDQNIIAAIKKLLE